MKRGIRVGLALVAAVLLLAAGAVYAKDFEVQKKAGDYTVTFKLDRATPSVGDNNADISIKDAAGADVTDAKVVVNYSMPAMPGMPAMSYKTDAQLKGTVYKAKITPSMAGSWGVDVKVTRDGKTVSAKFSIDAK